MRARCLLHQLRPYHPLGLDQPDHAAVQRVRESRDLSRPSVGGVDAMNLTILATDTRPVPAAKAAAMLGIEADVDEIEGLRWILEGGATW